MTKASPLAPEHVGFWRAPFAARTWREQAYLLIAMLTGIIGFVWFVLTIALIPALAVTVIGLFVGGGLVVGARGWGAMHRGLARTALRTDVAPPAPWRRGRGFWRLLGSMLGDAPGWRAVWFMLVEFILGLTALIVTLSLLITSVGAMTHWYWYRWLPEQITSDGTLHRGAQLGNEYFIDTPPRQLVLAAMGLLLLFVWAKAVLGFGQLFRLLINAMLSSTGRERRLETVTRSRAVAVTDADTRLRRIERDLHDGTQARLTAVAMQLGDARDRLASGEIEPAIAVLDDARGALSETMVELREIARGIRPPALDSGLALALDTLASRSPLPVTLDVDEDLHAAPEVESIAYFCVAELLANVSKHSGATGAYVIAERITSPAGDHLRIRVRDDGRGGAVVLGPEDRPAGPGGAPASGTGLHGLTERLETVDGTLELLSPVGGPTVITVTLPTAIATGAQKGDQKGAHKSAQTSAEPTALAQAAR